LGMRRATGAVVSAVDRAGPAAQAGLRPADVLETIDGAQQADSRAFMRSIVKMQVGAQVHLTHQSVIKTTFVLYFAMLAGIRSACNAMGAVSIIGRWKPFV